MIFTCTALFDDLFLNAAQVLMTLQLRGHSIIGVSQCSQTQMIFKCTALFDDLFLNAAHVLMILSRCSQTWFCTKDSCRNFLVLPSETVIIGLVLIARGERSTFCFGVAVIRLSLCYF